MATPTEFAQQMKVTIPRKIADKAQRVYLDSILQADAMLAKDVKHGGRTPVDTGYMRATRTGRVSRLFSITQALKGDNAGPVWRNQS